MKKNLLIGVCVLIAISVLFLSLPSIINNLADETIKMGVGTIKLPNNYEIRKISVYERVIIKADAIVGEGDKVGANILEVAYDNKNIFYKRDTNNYKNFMYINNKNIIIEYGSINEETGKVTILNENEINVLLEQSKLKLIMVEDLFPETRK